MLVNADCGSQEQGIVTRATRIFPAMGVAGAPLHERSAQRYHGLERKWRIRRWRFRRRSDSAARSRLSSLRTIVDLGAAFRKSVGAVHLTRGGRRDSMLSRIPGACVTTEPVPRGPIQAAVLKWLTRRSSSPFTTASCAQQRHGLQKPILVPHLEPIPNGRVGGSTVNPA